MLTVRKICGVGLLALLLVCGEASGMARAQVKPASAPAKDASAPAQQASPGPAQQLVRRSNEAAGRDTGNKEEEKDETAEFKQSASVRLIAKYLAGGNLQHAYWLSVVLNFVVIAALILWAGRKFLPGMFRVRTEAIQKSMQEAQKASEEARRRLADIEARLMKLDVEIGMMRDAAEKEGAAEVARIQAGAQEDGRKIVGAAEQEIAAAAKAARRQLTAYAGDLAVSLAQKQIRVDASTDQALVRNFALQLSTSEGQGKSRN